MKSLGAVLIVIGLGSYVLPLLGMQFRLMAWAQDKPVAGIIVAGVGAVLLAAGVAKDKAASRPRTPSPQPTGKPPLAVPGARPVSAPGPRCPHCGQSLAAGDAFCWSCGKSTALAAPPASPPGRCPNPRCGRPVAAGKKFCTACGTRVI